MIWDSLFFYFAFIGYTEKERYFEESKKLIDISKSTGMTKADALRTAIEDLYLKECGGRING